MSHPIEPQGRENTPESDRSSVSAGNYSTEAGDHGIEQNGRSADPTIDLGGVDRRAARDRAEFDQDFDDQARLHDGGAAAAGPYGGAAEHNRYPDQDRTVRTDSPGSERTVPAGGLPNGGYGDPAGTTARYPAVTPGSAIDDEQTHRAMPTTIPPDRQTVAAREKERFGGMSFGSGFFGWLTATGMAVLLITLVAAAGVALGIASNDTVDQVVQDSQTDNGTARTVGLVGGILLLVILFISYFCGGYVAGRMARFSGAKQGLAVWLWALITTAVIAAVAAIAGSQYNVLAQLNLPRIPVDEGSVTTAGIIAIGAAILVALIGALLGGIAGTRFHRRVDAVGFSDEERIF